MSGISQQNPARVFVSHAFAQADDYDRVFEYLESVHNFYYRNCSNPELRVTDREAMKEELRKQISFAEIVIVSPDCLNVGFTSEDRLIAQ